MVKDVAGGVCGIDGPVRIGGDGIADEGEFTTPHAVLLPESVSVGRLPYMMLQLELTGK